MNKLSTLFLTSVLFAGMAFGLMAANAPKKDSYEALKHDPKSGIGHTLVEITKKDKEKYKLSLKELDLGLDTRMTTKMGLLSGGQRQAITLLMATLKRPKLLLLDEHTAALDPKTAAKVLEITDRLVKENSLTALMVTHNMKDAIAYGNRLIMMNAGKIILDVKGEEKKSLTIEALLEMFTKASGAEFASDRALLS